MTQFLPPNLLALFAPRDPIPFLPQLEKLPHEKHHNQPYCGIAPFIRHFEDPRDAPPPTRAETRDERLERKRREKIERRQTVVETELKLWDPHNDPNAQGDAFKTLFVARVNYDTTESKLRREFEVYGPIKRIYIVYNKRTGKPRGYAFIEYEHERDMHSSYKHADGKKIDGRRVLVDVERGRTVKGWQPRRLGGGLGGTRRGGADVNIKHSGRDDASRYDERPLGGDRDRGERGERSRDRDKDRERRRSRSRDRRRPTRSSERDRERPAAVGEEAVGNSRRRERDRDRVAPAGTDSRSRERSKDRDRKRRSRSRDRKRDRERAKGLEGEEVNQGDGVAEGGERLPEEAEGEAGEGVEERRDKDRDKDRDRRRSHRDRDRRSRGDRDRDRDHKRERGDRDRGERREERHGSLREDTGPQDDVPNEEGGETAPNMEESRQDGMMDQQSVPDEYGSGENGYNATMEATGDEY
ncbi:U1 small nuclear ribonucleoprotein 70 kDa [Nerophis ophidion]|uniref:U1 small nuclear ribonucleoprotein 70 kDa n=1 Tax=Nerophis ophidion TaxID=159077 RepID=UPI002ADF56A2|nr:U1 small nuclear ribonucleoprotein 70 kDa [Nerophis ophidion]